MPRPWAWLWDTVTAPGRRHSHISLAPIHSPNPPASIPGSLRALLFLQGTLREWGPSTAPSSRLLKLEEMNPESAQRRPQPPRRTVPQLVPPAEHLPVPVPAGRASRAGGTLCRSSHHRSVLLISVLSYSKCCGRSKPGNEQAVSICARDGFKKVKAKQIKPSFILQPFPKVTR